MGNSEGRSAVASVLGDVSYRSLFVMGFSYWCLFFLFGWKPSQAIMGFDLDASWIFFMGGITAASAILAVVFELRFPSAAARSSLSLVSSATVSLAFVHCKLQGARFRPLPSCALLPWACALPSLGRCSAWH